MKKLTITMIILDILVAACFIVVYCVPSFRNMIISTAMVTKSHQYIAFTFYSEEMVSKVMSLNQYIPITDQIDLDKIIIDTSEKAEYDNAYDEAILTRDKGNKDYKYIKVDVGGYDAHLVALYNPAKVKLITSKAFNTGTGQETVLRMCERQGGLVCINGGGFSDLTGWGSDIPIGTLIKDGKVIWTDSDARTSLIGFNKENKLVLANLTPDEAIEQGIRDALQFGPFLMVNGKKISYSSAAGGYDRAARVAIAQRKDGVVLFLVTEGVHTRGPSLLEVADLLEKYGAYNIANLDGGTSSQLVIKGKLINDPKNIYGSRVIGGRTVVSGFGLLSN